MKRVLIAAAVAALASCGEDLSAHACEHVAAGGFAEVAGANDNAAASALKPIVLHEPSNVTLVGDAPNRSGIVTLTPNDEGVHHLFLGKDVPITLKDGDTAITETSKAAQTACAEVAVEHVFTLSAGKTYTLRIGPTSETKVLVVPVPEAGH